MMNLNPFIQNITNHVLSIIRQENRPTEFITGVVTSINPLKIQINDKQILEQDELLLSATVKETWINIPTTPSEDGSLVEGDEDGGTDGVFMHRHHIVAETQEANDGGQGAQNHKHTIDIYTKYELPKIRLWRGLIVGDVVRLLKIQGGQLFFVIEREETITNETLQVEGEQ